MCRPKVAVSGREGRERPCNVQQMAVCLLVRASRRVLQVACRCSWRQGPPEHWVLMVASITALSPRQHAPAQACLTTPGSLSANVGCWRSNSGGRYALSVNVRISRHGSDVCGSAVTIVSGGVHVMHAVQVRWVRCRQAAAAAPRWRRPDKR